MIWEKLSVSFGTSSSAVGSTMKTTSYCLFVSNSNLHPSIKLAHRFQSAIPDNRSYRVCAQGDRLLDDRSLTFRKRVEHESLRIRDRMFRLNPDPQADELIRPDRRDNRFQTVVPTSRAALAYANRSERQREVIRNHDELIDRRLALNLREQTRDRLSTQVHEGLRFY